MARILLGVTGSVAAIRTAQLVESLTSPGHTVELIVTRAARYFVGDESSVAGAVAFHDEDEWPTGGYQRGDPILHIELRKRADVLVVAPLDAQTLAKFALGLSDNLLSCVFRAWDFTRPVILAPAMNTLMWESPVTRRHLAQILADRGDGMASAAWTLETVSEVFAAHAPSIVVVPPQSKQLACGDHGIGAMADVPQIARAVQEWLAEE
jgi:phosphopantothenoylcysteine decarboxylase